MNIVIGTAKMTSRYGPSVGAEVLVLCDAIQSQPIGTTIHRNTLPSAISSTSSSATGLVRIDRSVEGRAAGSASTADERASLLWRSEDISLIPTPLGHEEHSRPSSPLFCRAP